MLVGCDQLFQLDRVNEPTGPSSDAMTADGGLASCPADYVEVDELPYRYRAATSPAVWQAADDDCRDDSETAITHLPVFASSGELAVFALRFFVGSPPPPYLHAGYARDIDQDPNSFRPVTGGAMVSGLWASSEPNNLGGTETVTAVEIDSRALEDGSPTSVRSYVCVCDGVPANERFNLAP